VGIDFGKLKTTAARAREAKKRPFNPEVPPELMLGDIGYFIPELEGLEGLDRDMTAWWLNAAGAGAAIFILIVIAVVAGAWLFGVLGL
jgi:hypothetical protein